MFHRIIIYRLNSFQCSPFRDSIYRVFSSKKDERLSLEDVLDLCSAFSEYCPDNVRATWAFYVFGNVIHFNFFFFDELIEEVERSMQKFDTPSAFVRKCIYKFRCE